MQRNSVNAMFGMFMAGPSGLGVMHSLLECRTPDCVDSEICEVFVINGMAGKCSKSHF